MKNPVLSAGLLAALGGATIAGCPDLEDQVGPVDSTSTTTSTPAATLCVAPQPKPPPVLPWKDVDDLCQAPHGKPWAGLPWSQGEEKVALALQSFLRNEEYKQASHGWLRDAGWRMTGPFEGCPCPDQPGGECSGFNHGPHPAVRVYYSPEVIDWMCTYRRGPDELPGAGDMPDNAMIIKESINPNAVQLATVPGSDRMWVAPIPGKPADHYDQAFTSWTVMVKNRALSTDGWFWAYFDKSSSGNPPIWDRAAFTKSPFPGQDGARVDEPPGCDWLPTYWQYTVPAQQYPNAQAGNYCVYCHASSQGQTTFASFGNLLGTEIQYPWLPPPTEAPRTEEPSRATMNMAAASHLPSTSAKPASPDANAALPSAKPASPDANAALPSPNAESPAAPPAPNQCPNSPFPNPRSEPLPGFRQAFPELDPPYSEVWDTRLPSHSWDHAPSRLGVASIAPASSQFLTSDQCESCHEAGGQSQLALPYMVEKVGDAQIDLSPWAEWSVSPMGLAGRDPVFLSQLELERNLARAQPGLAAIMDCIDNTCLHCHGGAGARQYNIDTAGQAPAGDPCKDFLPAKDQRHAANYDGALFTGRMVAAWRDESPELARYGGLARDGITCTMCHHLADEDLEQKNLPRTFTGNFRVGPPDRLYGPFPNEPSKEAVKPKPMQHTLGITPEAGKQLLSSEMCATCHTVVLPVFDDTGKLAGAAYEQTTYLEWLLSDFGGYGPGQSAQKSAKKTCQGCHMPHEYRGKPIHTGIANVHDSRYPEADYLLPAEDIDIATRPYQRHKLYGLNVFLNAYAQQYPILLGIRQQDFMNGNVTAPLLTGLESVLQVAAEETAELTLGHLSWKADTLVAEVTVRNLGGHSLPSGVGFRRLFLQVEVLDANDRVMWASGRTSAAGLLLKGTTDEPLPTESLQPGADGLPFQPHRQIVTAEDQVQIYEELTQDATKQLTTSFLHRYWDIKDNRLRPSGYSPGRAPEASLRKEYEAATRPGTGPERNWWPLPAAEKYTSANHPAIEAYTDTLGDPDYQLSSHPGTGLPGSDTVTYQMTLPTSAKSAARRVRVSLYSQSTPPYFLAQRFREAAKPGAERAAAARMYYMAGHLDTSARSEGGTPYLAGYRLQIGRAVLGQVPPP